MEVVSSRNLCFIKFAFTAFFMEENLKKKKKKKKKKSQNSFGSLELHQNYVSVPFKGISDKSLKCFLINV